MTITRNAKAVREHGQSATQDADFMMIISDPDTPVNIGIEVLLKALKRGPVTATSYPALRLVDTLRAQGHSIATTWARVSDGRIVSLEATHTGRV